MNNANNNYSTDDIRSNTRTSWEDIVLTARSSLVTLVSFDIFDTLLLRQIPAEQVVRESAHELASLLSVQHQPITAQEIEEHRAAFAAEVYRRPVEHEKEWMLDDWLSELARALGLNSEQVLRLGVQAELTVEQRSLCPAAQAWPILAELRAEGWTLLAISDSNHSQASLIHLLHHFGIQMDRVYSSASAGRSKRLGTLFHHVAKEMNRAPIACLHFGDDWKRDVERGRAAGWQTHWLVPIKPNISIELTETAN